MGLAVGPWLRAFKEATLRGADDAAPIEVAWAEATGEKPDALPFGLLILKLAEGADTLFIEGSFLECDSAAAAARRHLTARQAGRMARLAGAKRLATFHYSPQYKGQSLELAREAQDAFLSG